MKRLIFTLAMLAAVQASAQTIKPGLWEVGSKAKTGNPQNDQAMAMMAQHMASLPPEQKAQMEALMAQKGMSMPKAGADGAMVMSVCVTPEMAAKKELPLGQKGKCTSKNEQVAGGMDFSFSCADPASSGQGKLRFNGDNNYTMTLQVNNVAGMQQSMLLESTGRWIGATCPAKPH